MAMAIDGDECISCGACESECPTGSISEGKFAFKIDPATCTECEGEASKPQCAEVCPTGCIALAT